MTVMVDLSPEVERRLKLEAEQTGMELPQLVQKVLSEYAAPPVRKKSALEIFEQWQREDGTDNPEEIARREQEFEEFKRGMNENHTSYGRIYP